MLKNPSTNANVTLYMEDLRQDPRVTKQSSKTPFGFPKIRLFSFLMQVTSMVTLPSRGSLTTDESKEKLRVIENY